VPSIRYARDKRGYETTSVVHQYRSAGGPGPTRLLYLFRSPSYVTVGRHPLDDEARVALEHTHPDVSFDWQGLGREMAQVREPARPWREREARGARPESGRAKPPAEDGSVLGRALGQERAAQLRARYAELLQRVERRARTPEEREELNARLARLNPEDWTDAEAVAAGVATVESEFEAIKAALPQRRRGRRGGRRRENGPTVAEDGGSAIIAGEGDLDEIQEGGQVDGLDRDAGHPGDSDRLGAAGNGFQGDD